MENFGDDLPGFRLEPRKAWTVSELTRRVGDLLVPALSGIWVEGEVSNPRRPPSGHVYFDLKDRDSCVRCVVFRSAVPADHTRLFRQGAQIEVRGDLTVYPVQGVYQIQVRRAEGRGRGELEARLRELQERLRAEGLFDAARKRPLPFFPRRVGVVTSPTGAAIRDFLKVLSRRAPHVRVFVAPVRVQGQGAAREIASALQGFADPSASGFPEVDLIVLTRGGGSLEDLWEFNAEEVARAVAASPVPVVTGIGHEIDFTTADFVADLRAPTPSAAAELCCPARSDLLQAIGEARRRVSREAAAALRLRRMQLGQQTAAGTWQLPLRRLQEWRQRADDALMAASEVIGLAIRARRERLMQARSVLRVHAPAAVLALERQRLGAWQQRVGALTSGALDRHRLQLRHRRASLEMLNPRRTLERGYTMTLDEERRPLARAGEARRCASLVTVFADGEVVSRPLAD